MSKRFYLAGACKNVPDGGTTWRKQITKMVHDATDIKGVKVDIFDPTDYFSYEEKNYITDKQVKDYYLYQLNRCDAVILNAEDTEFSIGTAMEVQFATDHHIPIIGFGTKNIYNWIKVDCMCIYETMEEAVNFVKDFML